MVQNRFTSPGLKHDAMIVTRGYLPCGCIISAVTEGMDTTVLTLTNLTSPAVRTHFQESPPCQADVYIFPKDGKSEQRIHISGQVSVTANGSLTLRGDKSANTSANTVPDLRDPGLLDAAVKVLSNPSAIAALKNLYYQHAMRLVKNLVSSFIEGVRTNIEGELEQAAEVRKITRLKDMRFIFSSRENQIFRDFSLEFQTYNEHLNPARPGTAQDSELTVLQQPAFEDWLELQLVASDIASKNANTLFVLHQLLNQLSSQDINDTTNPLSPQSLCRCLQYTVDRLGIAREHRHTLYLAFEDALKDMWLAAAKSLIRDLFRGGLHALNLINLPRNWSLREWREAPRETREIPVNTGKTAAPSADIHGQSVFRMMGLQRDSAHAREEWPATNPRFSEQLKPLRTDLIKSLKQPGPSMGAAIRTLANTDTALADSLDDATWDKVDLVDRLFAPLEQQPGLTGSLRDQLEQLRLPVFEVLLETPDFLDQKDHPTREIVNDLMRLCLAERSSSRSLEQTVTAIIDELIQAEEPSQELYRAIGVKLKELVERQDHAFLRNSERIATTLEGKQRLKDTRLGVQRRLNMMLGGTEVPAVLLELLASGWEQLIVLAVLREGPDSHTCSELLNVVDQIRLWLAPGEISDNLAFERGLESDVVLQLVDRELRTVGEVSRVRAAITNLADQLHHRKPVQTIFVSSYPPGQRESAPLPQKPEEEDTRWSRRARQINVGDWVEMSLADGEKRRMRLVWGGEDVFRFVFLSPRGMNEVSYGFSEFVAKLAAGEIWLVSQGDIPFVDQSLFDIVQDVYRKLNFEATHDTLTGCLLRHDFEKHLSQTLGELSDGEACVLIAFDIDEFNIINASYGTQAGDALLRRFGTMLQEQCATLPMEVPVGRLGGNEFAMLAWPMAVEASHNFAEHIRKTFQKESFQYGEAEYTATLSISICPVEGTGASAGGLLSEASNALKSVKRLGGNRVEILRHAEQQKAKKGVSWVSRIDRSIRDGSLYLRAQKIAPIADQNDEASQDKGERYELLLGLTDASGQEISPQGYIEAAEQFRRSSRVDLWVVDEVLNWMTRTPKAIARINTLNVNLSGASLSDDAFLYELECRLKRHRDLTPKLCFEVTETSAVASLHYAADFMNEMKKMQCRFALDDFGTGLSSYAYLQKLPVDYVKIDGVFVRDMASNLTNYALVRSINELSHFLNMQTIAEYVEDLETLDTLREIQVDFAQGYGIAKPRRIDLLGTAPNT